MKIVLATHNPGKLKEFALALAPYEVDIVSAASLGLDEPEETGKSFQENALIKARAVSGQVGLPALADDSGLCVRALAGAPGIYSGRWAGPQRNFTLAMERIYQELGKKSDRSASFICVLAYVDPDRNLSSGVLAGERRSSRTARETIYTGSCYEGEIKGRIVWPPRGEEGFGYDPIFEPEEGRGMTFAEMSRQEKQRLSHRGRALQKFIQENFGSRPDR